MCAAISFAIYEEGIYVERFQGGVQLVAMVQYSDAFADYSVLVAEEEDRTMQQTARYAILSQNV